MTTQLIELESPAAPLVAPQAQRASELFNSSIVVLTHDHVGGLPRWGETDADLLRSPAAGVTCKALFVQVDCLSLERHTENDVFEASLHQLDGFRLRAEQNIATVKAIIERHPDQLTLARSTADILAAKQTGKCAIVLAFEGGKPLEGELENLDRFYELGLRHLQLCWACPNQLCDRGLDNEGGRLTDFGRQVIQRAEQLGIVIDPTHATDRIYFETLEMCTKPIICGHVSVRGPKDKRLRYPGDMDDARLAALRANRGLMGIHFWAHYLRSDRLATVSDIVDHIAYVAELIGIDHVALGPDFANSHPSHLAPERHQWALESGQIYHMGPLPDVNSVEKLPRVVDRMLIQGFSESEIRKVLGLNYLRVMREVIDARKP